MSLIRWEPFDEFDRFFKTFENLGPVRSTGLGYDMAVDLYEDGNDLVVEMNVSGLKADDIDVEVEDNYLRIAGHREEVQEKKEKSHYQKEIRRGSFDRLVHLPDMVDQTQVQATYKDGVLTVRMPKRATEQANKVRVQVQ